MASSGYALVRVAQQRVSFALGKFDDLVHGRLRLGVMAYVAQAEAAELKDPLEVTQGNLSVHLRKFEGTGGVALDKRSLDRKPLTRVRMTVEEPAPLCTLPEGDLEVGKRNEVLTKLRRTREQ